MDTLRNTLHERGLRMTPQRQLVLDAVRDLGHATPEQVCAAVQRFSPAVNITTVYRTLDLLQRLQLVRHTHLGHGAPAYSVREHQHLHLVCHWCGEVAEAPLSLLVDLTAQLRADFGFRLDASHLALSGGCANCAGEARRPRAEPSSEARRPRAEPSSEARRPRAEPSSGAERPGASSS